MKMQHGNSQDKTLRIKINVDKLLKALNDFSSQTGFNIYRQDDL